VVELQDLRQNCYVILKTTKEEFVNEKVCYVCGIDEDKTITLRSISSDKKYSCKTSNLKGIRLTKNLIEEIGFNKQDDGDYLFLIKSDDLLDVAIVYSEKKFNLQLSYLHDPEDLLGQTLSYEMEHFKYLHHLQNVYRDFNGEDMDIIKYLEE
jgi:hypothetical protein